MAPNEWISYFFLLMPSPSGKGVLGDARFRGTKSEGISKGTSLSYTVVVDYNTIAHVKRFLWGLGGPQCKRLFPGRVEGSPATRHPRHPLTIYNSWCR